MQKKTLFFICIIISFLTILSLVSCSKELEDSPERQVTALIYKGQPEILRSGQSVWQPLEHKTAVFPGDAIRTGDDSWVYLEITDGSLAGLTPNTQASLVTLSASIKDPVTLFDLAEGLMYVRVTKELGKGSFKVSTPVLTGSVVGSKMSVEYIPSLNAAEVACFEGEVEVEINYDAAEGQSCHLISGVKLAPSSLDDVTITKCEHPPLVQELEVQAYSSWEKIYIDLEFQIQTETARANTQTRQAQFTKTPTATAVILPTETPLPSLTPTITLTPLPVIRPTITVDPDAPLSAEEEANSGVHNYSFTAAYTGVCKGPTSGEILQMNIQFEGNQAILSDGSNRSVFDKVDVNTYQAVSGVDVVIMTFTQDGFMGDTVCVNWVYTRQ